MIRRAASLAYRSFITYNLPSCPSPANHAPTSGILRSVYASRLHTSAQGSVNPATAIISEGVQKRRGIAGLYLQLLQKHPILTKSLTAGTIYFFADVSSQGICISQAEEAESVQYDVGRTLRMVASGFLMSGPTLHFWFNFMSRTFPRRDLASTLKKMALGQTVYGPSFTVIFFSLNAFVQGESMDEVISRLKRDFFPTIRSGLMYWPLCDFITYRYVPVHLQPLVSNSFSYIWTIYLTYMAGLKKAC